MIHVVIEHIKTQGTPILAFTPGGFAAGIAIELIQIKQRWGSVQNTKCAMVLDAIMTGVWPLVLWIRLGSDR